MEWTTTVLALDGLRIEAHPRPTHFGRWFDCSIAVDAHPFAGVRETTFTDADLVTFADAPELLNAVGEATLGGGRAAELPLIVEHQIGGGVLVIECSLIPSGDDPYPSIHSPYSACGLRRARRRMPTAARRDSALANALGTQVKPAVADMTGRVIRRP